MFTPFTNEEFKVQQKLEFFPETNLSKAQNLTMSSSNYSKLLFAIMVCWMQVWYFTG